MLMSGNTRPGYTLFFIPARQPVPVARILQESRGVLQDVGRPGCCCGHARYRVRYYLVSSRNHGIQPIDAIQAALTGRPWLPSMPRG
jgi:hypothetical protein